MCGASSAATVWSQKSSIGRRLIHIDILTPIKAIRMKCLECCNWSRPEVARCQIRDCSLWAYRMGRRPSEEDAAAVAAATDSFAAQKIQAGIGVKDGRAQNGQNLNENRRSG